MKKIQPRSEKDTKEGIIIKIYEKVICLIFCFLLTFTGCSSKVTNKTSEHRVCDDIITSEGDGFYCVTITNTTIEREYEEGTMPTFNIIKNKFDFDNFIKQFNKKYKLSDISFMAHYNEEYFKTKSVIFIKTIEKKSESKFIKVQLINDATIEISKKAENTSTGFVVMFTALEISNQSSVLNKQITDLSVEYQKVA